MSKIDAAREFINSYKNREDKKNDPQPTPSNCYWDPQTFIPTPPQVEGVCPCCGYCSHCKRGGNPYPIYPVPYYPSTPVYPDYPWYSFQPYITYVTKDCTCSGADCKCNG